MARRAQKVQPVRYTAESPLVLGGTVPSGEERPAAWAGVLGPLEWFVGHLPARRDTRSGRDSARFAKALIALAAVGVAVGLPSPVGLYIAAAMLPAVFVLPLRRLRKTVWLERIQRWRAPRLSGHAIPATLHFDGRKLSIRAEERGWRSIRPEVAPHRRVLGSLGGAAVLAWIHPRSPKESLWVMAPGAAAGLPPLPEGAAPTPAQTCTVDEAAWATLLVALDSMERSE
jgi:hypothetical protein